MTDSLFFDTDCLCAFLWVNEERLLTKLYEKRIVIPRPVYQELCYPRIAHLKQRVDTLVSKGEVIIEDIAIDSEEYETYYSLSEETKSGQVLIGHGEAAAIALAKRDNGILASNNLRDITAYVSTYELRHVTTAEIMVDAYDNGLIDETKGNIIWANMLAKKRKIGLKSFSDCIGSKNEWNDQATRYCKV